jgi:hypothetical protein
MSVRTAYIVMVETDIDQNDPPKTVKEMVAIYASASEADMSATLLAKYAPSNKCFYTIEKPLFIAPRSRKETK